MSFRGDGEWLSRKHGATRRREWRKVHLAMDTATGDIRAVEFTSSRQGDSPILPELLSQIPSDEDIETVTAPSRQHPADAPAGQWMVPMTRAAAMRRSLSMERTRSYRSVAMDAPGNPTAPPRYRETRYSGRRGVWGDRSGRSGRATTPEVVSKHR